VQIASEKRRTRGHLVGCRAARIRSREARNAAARQRAGLRVFNRPVNADERLRLDCVARSMVPSGGRPPWLVAPCTNPEATKAVLLH
jgi:hypothetical protein